MNLTHPHILVVDDHADIRDLLKRFLEQHGYRVSCARDGREMKKLLEHSTIQLIVLDLMLPGEDGLTLCRELRVHSAIPIVMLTAMGDESDKVAALNAGADDYVTKPFSPAELTARIDALYRRIGSDPAADAVEIRLGPFTLNTRNRTLDKEGRRIKLTQVEYAIVKLFMQNPGRALSREDILAAVWGRDYDGELKIVDVNIRRLRIKIEDDTANPTYITTVWGFGYKWGA